MMMTTTVDSSVICTNSTRWWH